MVKHKKQHKKDDEQQEGSQVTNGTHETKNSLEEKKVAESANGSGEVYGNET